MKFFYMVLVNCKKYFKDYKSIASMFLTPIIIVLFVNNVMSPGGGSDSLGTQMGIVNLDKGTLGKEFAEKLNPSNIYNDKEKALKELKNYNIIALYEISENFTEEINNNKKPVINSYKLEAGNKAKAFEIELEKNINELYKIQLLKRNNIIKNDNELKENIINVQYNTEENIFSADSFLPIMIIIFLLLINSGSISNDLLKLKKEKILERFLSTGNKGYAIMGSIYLSMIITQVIMYTASFITMKLLFKIAFDNFGVLILNIALMSMISISLAIMVNRVLKNPGSSSIVTYLTSIIMFFLYLWGINGESPTVLGNMAVSLSKFSPFYWAFESIEKSILFPNALVLILMALTFFTAGSIRYSNFAKE
ncbi:ABC transporter permease [Dethiothermospora halolimnae]|uniref:ABC transporter permease n=1 Tax=Dethiothermospora halolimnae TaxID=3114390 RepID=UPI003CCBF2E2